MKPVRFHRSIRVKLDHELRDALEQAADHRRTSMSEAARQMLRAAISMRPPAAPDDNDPDPFRPAPAARLAA